MVKKVNPEGGLRTASEASVGPRLAGLFEQSPGDTVAKLDQFPKYIRRQRITRLLALYELFKLVIPVKGSIVECGVHQGFGLACWNHFSAILEPNNLIRRIYGFDTFDGFSSIDPKDKGRGYSAKAGDLRARSDSELKELFRIHDDNRFLGHIDKVTLVKGDIIKTAAKFVRENQHILVSLLFLDMDLFKPTEVALRTFLPRMPKGAIIAFDELDNPIWPGETLALLSEIGANRLELRRFDFDPYIAYARVE
jgi:hypothetical protein